jgi:hypothetical protein
MPDIEDLWPYLLIIAFVVAVGAIIVGAVAAENKQWQAFSTAHHCRVTAKISGDLLVSNTVSSSGKIGLATTSTPDKTGYTCDDGVTYYR